MTRELRYYRCDRCKHVTITTELGMDAITRNQRREQCRVCFVGLWFLYSVPLTDENRALYDAITAKGGRIARYAGPTVEGVTVPTPTRELWHCAQCGQLQPAEQKPLAHGVQKFCTVDCRAAWREAHPPTPVRILTTEERRAKSQQERAALREMEQRHEAAYVAAEGQE